MSKSNPAARLLSLLREAMRQPDMPVYEMWRHVLGVADKDHRAFLRLSHELLSLYMEVVERVGGFEKGNKTLFLSWTEAVEIVLSPTSYNHSWDRVKPNLKPDVIRALEFTADRLDTDDVATEETIPEEQLKKLLADVEELQKSITESDLEKSVKAILWQQAENIRIAVHGYKIRGASAVKESLERAFGAVLINGDVFKEQRNHPLVVKFLRVVDTAHKCIAPVLKLGEVAGAVKKLFSGD